MPQKPQLTGFTPAQGQHIWDTLDKLVGERQMNEDNERRDRLLNVPPQTPLYFRNDSGEEIPAFACMQAIGTVEIDGQNYFRVDKPRDSTGEAGPYLFNLFQKVPSAAQAEETECAAEYGTAVAGTMVRVLATGTVEAGDKLGPVAGSWYVGEGTLINAAGPDDIRDDVIRGTVIGAASSPHIIEFEIVDAGYDPDKYVDGTCDNLPSGPSGDVLAKPLKASSGDPNSVPGRDEDGNVTIVDDTGFFTNRSADDLVGKKGFAVYMTDGYVWEWVVIWVDWFRKRLVVVDWRKTADQIIVEFENLWVWNHCEADTYSIDLTDCPDTFDYSNC